MGGLKVLPEVWVPGMGNMNTKYLYVAFMRQLKQSAAARKSGQRKVSDRAGSYIQQKSNQNKLMTKQSLQSMLRLLFFTVLQTLAVLFPNRNCWEIIQKPQT